MQCRVPDLRLRQLAPLTFCAWQLGARSSNKSVWRSAAEDWPAVAASFLPGLPYLDHLSLWCPCGGGSRSSLAPDPAPPRHPLVPDRGKAKLPMQAMLVIRQIKLVALFGHPSVGPLSSPEQTLSLACLVACIHVRSYWGDRPSVQPPLQQKLCFLTLTPQQPS